MVAPPSTLKTDGQIVTYYYNVAETLGTIPFVLQDFPLVTNVVIPTSVILTIIEDYPNCVTLKHEDWPGHEKISALRQASDAGGRRISILCGNGGLYLTEEMMRGAFAHDTLRKPGAALSDSTVAELAKLSGRLVLRVLDQSRKTEESVRHLGERRKDEKREHRPQMYGEQCRHGGCGSERIKGQTAEGDKPKQCDECGFRGTRAGI